MDNTIITDNTVEKLEFASGDGRCALIRRAKGLFPMVQNYTVIILNVEERKKLKELL